MKKKILTWTFLLSLLTSIILITIYVVLGGGFGVREGHVELQNGSSLVFAHRGMTSLLNENSIEGFSMSEASGFHALEMDVRKTNDDRLVIFHDRSCKRRLGLDVEITDVDFESIRDKNLLYNTQPTEYKMTTLDQALARFSSRMLIYLDIKDVNKTIADSVLWLLKKYNAYQSVLVADQSVVFLSYLKFKDPKVITVLESFYDYHVWIYPVIPKKFKPDYYASFLREVDQDHVEFLRKNNLMEKKIVYGVDKTNLTDVYSFGFRHVIIDYDSALPGISELEQTLRLHGDRQAKN